MTLSPSARHPAHRRPRGVRPPAGERPPAPRPPGDSERVRAGPPPPAGPAGVRAEGPPRARPVGGPGREPSRNSPQCLHFLASVRMVSAQNGHRFVFGDSTWGCAMGKGEGGETILCQESAANTGFDPAGQRVARPRRDREDYPLTDRLVVWLRTFPKAAPSLTVLHVGGIRRGGLASATAPSAGDSQPARPVTNARDRGLR